MISSPSAPSTQVPSRFPNCLAGRPVDRFVRLVPLIAAAFSLMVISGCGERATIPKPEVTDPQQQSATGSVRHVALPPAATSNLKTDELSELLEGMPANAFSDIKYAYADRPEGGGYAFAAKLGIDRNTAEKLTGPMTEYSPVEPADAKEVSALKNDLSAHASQFSPRPDWLNPAYDQKLRVFRMTGRNSHSAFYQHRYYWDESKQTIYVVGVGS